MNISPEFILQLAPLCFQQWHLRFEFVNPQLSMYLKRFYIKLLINSVKTLTKITYYVLFIIQISSEHYCILVPPSTFNNFFSYASNKAMIVNFFNDVAIIFIIKKLHASKPHHPLHPNLSPLIFTALNLLLSLEPVAAPPLCQGGHRITLTCKKMYIYSCKNVEHPDLRITRIWIQQK